MKGLLGRLFAVNPVDDDNRSNGNDNNDLDNNNGRLLGIGRLIMLGQIYFEMDKQDSLFDELCSYDNLYSAYEKARKRKTQKLYVLEFEKDLRNNLLQLRYELLTNTYKPKPLTTFIIRDPKTRKISKSHFRDRIIHHAICNVIEPIFDKSFIYDSYANRLGKGTLNAIKRFDYFKRKISQNNKRVCYVLKADIKHYFDNVNHNALISILKKKIQDNKILNLIKIILSNYNVGGGR